MANASSSPAKPLATLREGTIVLSIFPGPRFTVQRTYVFKNETKYANSFRSEDVSIVKTLLDKAVIKAHELEVAAADSQSAE